jgi:hypothetical protein
MVELLPPEIKATDSPSMDKSGDPVGGSLDSPSTGDGSQSARPKSSSSEGRCASPKLFMDLVIYSRHTADVLEAVVYGFCIYIHLGVFLANDSLPGR